MAQKVGRGHCAMERKKKEGGREQREIIGGEIFRRLCIRWCMKEMYGRPSGGNVGGEPTTLPQEGGIFQKKLGGGGGMRECRQGVILRLLKDQLSKKKRRGNKREFGTRKSRRHWLDMPEVAHTTTPRVFWGGGRRLTGAGAQLQSSRSDPGITKGC